MKKAIAIILLFVFSSAVAVVGANIDVSQSTNSTNNSEYDRNPSITYYNDSYWLFYAKGDDTSTGGVRGPGYSPDADGYVVWYKTASTIEGLASATETKLNLSETNRPSGFDQRVVTAVVASDGSNDCVYAIVSSGFAGPGWPSHGMYHYKWDGSSWTGPVMMVDPSGPDQYGAHVNAVSDGSMIYIVWDSAISNFFTYDPSTGTITGPTQISTDNMPKITLMGTVLYVVSIEDVTGDIEVRHSPNYGLSWFSHSTAISGAGMYDPCIFNDGTNLYVITAPWVPADRQYMMQTMSIGAGTTWSTPRTVSFGGYGSTEWWDYWPIGYYDGSDAYVFFTTETSSPAYSDGEIAFIKMDWDLGNDHYFYIQNAVDQATAGDIISVAAGTYVEQITIDKSLSLAGAGESVTTIQAPSARTGTVTEGIVTWDYIVAAYPSSGTIDIKIDGFTIDANNEDATDTDNLNFAGMFFRNVGDGIDDGIYSCTINNFGAYGAVWSSTYNTWMGNYGVVVYGTSDLDVDDNDIGDYTVSGVSAKGANVDVTVNGNNFDGSSSDYVGIFLRDGAGTIAGNTISDHDGVGANMGIYLYEASAGVNISGGNTISNNYIGIFLAGTDGATIDGNSFTNSLYRSIVIQQDSDNNIVSDNTITMVTGDVSSGIYIGSNSGGNVIGGDLADDGNDITLPTDGIGVRYCIHLAAADIDNVTIKNNSIAGGMRGVQFDGGPGHSGTNTISDNTITGSVFGGIMSYCHGDFVIEGNTVSGTDRPLEFWQAGNGDIAINDNNIISSNFDGINAGSYSSMTILGNSFEQLAGGHSVYNRQTSTVIDASGNWWGTTVPTEVAGKVSSHVDFTPWLGGGTDTAPGFEGDFSELWVDDDSPQTGTETCVQEGVDLVTGSTVNVMNGYYGADPVTGRCVYITTDGLNLIGESEAGVIIDGSIGGVGSSGLYWPKGIHVQANNITIENLTVDGFTGDMVSTGGYGILHRDYAHDTPTEGYIFYSGCTVNNVTVQNCYSVIYALCFTNLTVSNCNVVGNYSDGMFIARGCDNAVIHDNTVTNSGDHGIWVGNCWMGLAPSHNATIYNNDVNGAREGGISFVGSDVAEIYNNTITNAAGEGWSVGALSLKDGPTNVNAHDNTIYDNSGTWNGYNGFGHGVGIDGAASSITLYHNSIYGNSGFNVYNGSAGLVMGSWNERLIEDGMPLNSTQMIPDNPIIGSRELVMAEQNYWGTLNCPAITATIDGEVDFDPYCNDDFSDCSFTCDVNFVWVDDDWTGSSDGQDLGGGKYYNYNAFDIIMDAITAVTDYGTVNVAAGIYHNDITAGYWDGGNWVYTNRIDKSITLLGAQADVDPAGSTSERPGGESILTRDEGLPYSIVAPDVVINGFMNGSDSPNTGGRFIVGDDADDVEIKYCIIQNTPSGSSGHGVNVYPGAVNAGISYNTIANTAWEGIRNDGNAIISYNTIRDIPSNKGIMFSGSSSGSISNNTISNTFYEGIAAFASASITDNDISGCYHGVQIRGSATTYTIDGNNIHNNQYHGIEIPNYSGEVVAGVTITNNIFSDNPYCGVKVGGNTDGSGYQINNNTFVGNGIYGVESSTTADVDAEHNWWGAYCGPYHPTANPNGEGDAISDNVDFDPWCNDDFTDCTFSLSDPPAVVWVDDDYTATGYNDGHLWCYDAFDNIQDGLTAVAEGGLINVLMGTYTETDQIVIDKDITISGAGVGNTVVMKSEDTGDPSSGDNRGWFLVNPGYTLSMNDVTLDGDTRQICIAVLSFGEVGIADCEIKNIGWTPSSYYGRGVCLYGGAGNSVNQTSFNNILRIGVFTFGSGVNVDIDGCDYTGKGTGDHLDYAFEFGGGATGTISNSTIADNLGEAYDGSASAGILVTTYWGAGTAADITGSDISNSTLGIAVGYDSNDGSVVSATDGNLIHDNVTGIQAVNSSLISLTVNGNAIYGNTDFGISAGVNVSVDAESNWWGDASGPSLGAIVSGQTGVGLVQPSDMSGDNIKRLAKSVEKTSLVNVKDDKGSEPGLITYGSGDAVTSYVDYSPWWGDNYVGDSHLLPWTWFVDTSNNSTIQEGVDWASDGDAVYLTANTFTNPINIDERTNITIIGLDKSTSIYKPASTQSWAIPGYESRQAAIRVNSSHEIKLSNMTIDLDDVKGNNVTGILFWNSEGEISDNDIMNNCVPDGDGGYYEITSYLRAPDYSSTNRADILIRDNNFTQTGRLAIVTHNYVHAIINDNVFDQEIDDFGYAIEMGSMSTGVISGNIILNYDTPAASDGSSSAGLYVENAFTGGLGPITKDVTIEGNEIFNCQFGLYIGNEFDGYAGDVDINAVIQNNNIYDNVDGGIVITDEDRSAGSSVNLDFFGNAISSNGDVGVYIYTDGDGEIHSVFDNDLIIDNGTGMLIEDEALGLGDSEYDITINNSVISGNGLFGINNLVNTEHTVNILVVNAEENDWGHNTGPYHPDVCPETGLTNPLGQGDRVSNYVDYDPWYMGGCVFIPGDINGDGRVIGGDVTYGVNYFIGNGNPPPDSCWNDSTGDWHYSAADANGDCLFIGGDITYLVQYFIGGDVPPPSYCPQTPPAGPVLSVDEGTIIENEIVIPSTKIQKEVEKIDNSVIPMNTPNKTSNRVYQ